MEGSAEKTELRASVITVNPSVICSFLANASSPARGAFARLAKGPEGASAYHRHGGYDFRFSEEYGLLYFCLLYVYLFVAILCILW